MNKLSILVTSLACSLALSACVSTPVRSDRASVSASVAQAGVGAPRLPSPGEDYPDSSWLSSPLTVDRAVQGALLHHPRVRAELARLEAAQAERVQAGLLRNPMASLMALRPQGGGRFELDYGLMQSLFDLVTRSRRVAVADAAQRRVEAEVIGQLIAMAQDTQAAYYEAVIAQAELQAQREQCAIDDEILRLLQRQAAQGARSATAILEQQAVASRQAHDVQVAEAALTEARATLAGQLGLASADALILPVLLPEFVFPSLDEPALQAFATTHRPELQAAAAAVSQARAERELQTGRLRATEPALGFAGTRESGGMSLQGLELQITLPLFDTGRARRELATAQVAQAEFAQEAVRRQVPLEVERAIALLVATNIASGHADDHLHQQKQQEQLARRNYQQGLSDRVSYLQVSRAQLSAAMEQLEAQQARWAALVALARATKTAAIAQTKP